VQQGDKPVAPPRPQDPDVQRLSDSLAAYFGAAVGIRHGKAGNGKITIEYSSLSELDGILEKLKIENT